MEPGHASTPPTQGTWESSNIGFRRWIVPCLAWIALGWPAGLACVDLSGWGCAEIVAVVLAWCGLGLFAGVQTVRFFFRSKGALRKLAIVASLPLAVLIQHTLFDMTWGPPSDGALMADFFSSRAEIERQAPPGREMTIVKWKWTSPLITADNIYKGYVRTDVQPTPLVGSLDLAWHSFPRLMPAYRRIEGNWYLFLESR